MDIVRQIEQAEAPNYGFAYLAFVAGQQCVVWLGIVQLLGIVTTQQAIVT